MRSMRFILILHFVSLLSQSYAQTGIPKEFKKGTIVLANNTVMSGYIKDNIRRNASITWLDETGAKKNNYSGNELISLQTDSTKFICIKGDFFRVICDGSVRFLQKASNASGKPSYNGTEAIFINGTEGRPDDYFIYNNISTQLKLVTKKTFDEVIGGVFTGDAAAMDKAKEARNDIALLKEAIELHNSQVSK